MSFKKCVFLIVGLTLTSSLGSAGQLSWKPILEKFKAPDNLSALYQGPAEASLSKDKGFAAWLKSQQKQLTEIERNLQESSRWTRGEFEVQADLDRFITLFQSHLLYCRHIAMQKAPKEQVLRWQWWTNYSADLAYNEASLIGLRLSSVLRNLVLDEVERLSPEQKKHFAETPELMNFLVQIRAPWPIDRVVLSEGKRLAPPQAQRVVAELAQALQKNPYESMESIMGRVKGGASESMLFLRDFWTDKEISRMKAELNRIGRLQIDWAQVVYKAKTKQEATTAQDLVGAGLLPRVPLDYATGRTMSLKP